MKNWQSRLYFYSSLATAIILLSQLINWWVAELFSHFSFYGAVAILLVTIFIKHKIRYVFMLFSGFIIIWALLPMIYWQTSISATSSTQKILAYNVKISNDNKQEEIDFIKQNNADILLLSESGGDWQHYLQKLASSYQYGCEYEENSPFSLKILSKNILKNCQVKKINNFPYIRVESDNDRIIYAIHPPPPITKELAKQRNIYLSQVAKKISNEKLPTLVAGDMNSTAFSPIFRDFLQQANLQMHTYRMLPTWKPLFLPIDHILSRNTEKLVVSVTPLNWQFSDHRALLVNW